MSPNMKMIMSRMTKEIVEKETIKDKNEKNVL
jgi:hypothetical protein